MTKDAYEEYYLRQAGNGLPVFVGNRFQRGHGIGNVLGGLARMVVPILKRSGRALLKEGVKAGVGVLKDVAGGEGIKASARKRVKQTGSRLLNRVESALAPETNPPGISSNNRKRKSSTPRPSRGRKRQRLTKDIFD